MLTLIRCTKDFIYRYWQKMRLFAHYRLSLINLSRKGVDTWNATTEHKQNTASVKLPYATSFAKSKAIDDIVY